MFIWQHVLARDVKANDQTKKTKTDEETREKKFFSGLSSDTVKELFELFKVDFEMFGFDTDIGKYLAWAREPS